MKTTVKFITNAVQAALVFVTIFTLPAVMVSFIWLRFSLYRECVHNPIYCAVMFVMAGLVTYMYMGSRIDEAEKKKLSQQ